MKFEFGQPGISFQQIWWAFNRSWPFPKPRKLKKAELDFLKLILQEHHIVLSSIEYVHNGGKMDMDIFDKVKFRISNDREGRKGNWIGMMRVPHIHPYTIKWKKWTENSDLFPTSEAIVALLSGGPFLDVYSLDFDKSFGRKATKKDLEDWIEGPFYAWDPISIGCTKLEDFSYEIRSYDWIEILKAVSIYGQYMNMFKEDKFYRPQAHKGKYTHWDSAWESWDWSSRNSKFRQVQQKQKPKPKFTVLQGGKGSKKRERPEIYKRKQYRRRK